MKIFSKVSHREIEKCIKMKLSVILSGFAPHKFQNAPDSTQFLNGEVRLFPLFKEFLTQQAKTATYFV